MTKVECYVSFMESVAADPRHGYSQANRWGPDYDCSSLTIAALEQAGIPAKSNGATYTGNMYAVLTKIGFKDVAKKITLSSGKGLVRGDILLNHVHHVAVYVGSGKIVHARGQSYGSSRTGDQGQEIAVTNYYNYPWNAVLRYKDSVSAAPKNNNTVTQTKRIGVVGTCSVQLPCLTTGAICAEVGILQALLNAQGYRGKDGKILDVDNELGPNTAYAIEQLQRKYKFPDGTYWGTVAQRTWETILQGS